MEQASAGKVPLRAQAAMWGASLFSVGGGNMPSVAVPLMLLALDTPAFVIGVVVGARHVLSLVFSIHGGNLIDRLGARRVVFVCGLMSVIAPLLYPLTDNVAMTAIFQMFIGLASSVSWVGAQALVGSVMKGDPVHAGRISSAAHFGNLVSPVAVGIAWDFLGPWGAFGFMALWGVGLTVSATMLPERPGADSPDRAPVSLRVLVPNPRDYLDAIRMLAAPTIGVVILFSILNIICSGIESSFFVVYLESVGFTGTFIGTLLSAGSVTGVAGSLLAGRLLRWMEAHWVIVWSMVIALVSLMVTPLFTAFLPLLAFALLRGAVLGVANPLIISMVSRGVPPGSQGRAVGMRNSSNRVAHALQPVLMGAMVAQVGLEASFYLMGGILMAAVVVLALHIRRSPDFKGRV